MTVIAPSPTYQIIDADHERVGKWMHANGSAYWREGSTCIGLTRRGELVAGVMYDLLNSAAITTHIVIRGPITRKWLWYIFAYPFLQLKVNVIVACIGADHLKSQALVENMGFNLAADLPYAHPCGLLGIYTLYREDCRFIRSPYHG